MYREMLLQNNRPGTIIKPRGIVLHETSNIGVGAYNHYLYFNKPTTKASAHAVVDWVDVIQLIPYNEMAWHAGKTANLNYIGVEMCHAETQDQFDKVYQNTIDLFADILVDNLNISIVTKEVIMSHAEVSAKWHETDHNDPISYLNEFGKTMDGFRVDVQEAINNKSNGGVNVSKVLIVGEGKDIKVFVDGNEIDSSSVIETNGTTACMNMAKILRDIGHEVEWKAN